MSVNNSDYLENKFVTDDGFQVGYYVSKEQQNWYLLLEKYDKDNTVFVKNVETIEQAFNQTKQKKDELKTMKN